MAWDDLRWLEMTCEKTWDRLVRPAWDLRTNGFELVRNGWEMNVIWAWDEREDILVLYCLRKTYYIFQITTNQLLRPPTLLLRSISLPDSSRMNRKKKLKIQKNFIVHAYYCHFYHSFQLARAYCTATPKPSPSSLLIMDRQLLHQIISVMKT